MNSLVRHREILRRALVLYVHCIVYWNVSVTAAYMRINLETAKVITIEEIHHNSTLHTLR